MNIYLENIKKILDGMFLPETEKDSLLQAIQNADKQWTIIDFKLDRTEKVKKTTAILLEETIEELEQKRKAVEETNVALGKSLTELKATQQQLIQSEKMASLGELTAGIAHEIQNPLNFVNNFSAINTELIAELNEEMEKGNLDEVKQLLRDISANEEKIHHHGKRADSIVKGMLQHSRKSNGQKELTDLNELCDECIRLSYHGLRAKDKTFNAGFETNFDNSISKINILPQEIGRVLLNLFNNAFYATNERKKTAEEGYQPIVTVQTYEENTDGISIRVSDNGAGIPAAIREKIFQPFFTTKPTGEGTGLGLSLSYDIVTKSHGGVISVTSKEKEGTTFTIYLPYQPS